MKCTRYFLLTIFIALLCSCGTKQKLQKAEAMYQAGGYTKAAKLYRKVAPRIKDKTVKAQTYYKAGEAYRRTSNYAASENAYSMAIKNKYQHADALLYSAQAAIANEKLDNAKKYLKMYSELEPNNQQGIILQKSIELIEQTQPKSKYVLTNVKEINSRYHDYSPAFSQSDYESLYFSSLRKEGKGKSKVFDATGQSNSQLYSINQSKLGWDKPQLIPDDINTVDEEGSCVFDSQFTTLFYTQCKKEKGESFGCDIVAVRLLDESWGEPEELKLVPDSLVAAHPALSADGLTLFFTSNIPGGYGGMDIWKVNRGSTTDLLWSQPINLGPTINTVANEMYPSVRKDTLYFASNGRIGYGGLDIYKSTLSANGAIGEVRNLGKPFNSNADDFSIIFEPDKERGFFTSRRKGGKGGDDIYAFNLDIPVIEFKFSGSIRVAGSRSRIPGAEIRLIGSDGSSLKRKSGTDGSFEFKLQANTEYLAVVRKDGYFAQRSEKINTEGLRESKNFKEDILLTSFEKPLEIPNIFFEFGKADLSSQSAAALNLLSSIMDENAKIVVELRAHTDNRGSEEVNLVLSQKRAQAIIDYLTTKGIDEARMRAKGLGESLPRRVTPEIAAQHSFLKTGQILDEKTINSLSNDEQKEISHALNRRTEIQVISNDYEVAEE